MSRILKVIKSNLKFSKDKSKKKSVISYIDENTYINSNTFIDRFCVIHNSQIGEYSYLGYGCKLNNVEVGRYCSLASDIKIGLGKHPTNLLSTSPIFYSKKNPLGIILKDYLIYDDNNQRTFIGNDVWIGANVIIMDGVKIGDGAIVGAGSIVTRDIPPFTISVGVPAKVIRKRFDDETIERIIKSEWWFKRPDEVTKQKIYSEFRR